MTRDLRRLGALICVLAGSLAAGTPPVQAAPGQSGFAGVRQATAAYHDFLLAGSDGFELLRDAAGIACISSSAGTMGEHYVLGSRVGDPSEVATAPEVLIYVPQPDGSRSLVAVEYVVLASDWANAGNTAPPVLFGEQFALVPSGNRYGLPPFYELHAWIWEHNPSGVHADFNPSISCPA